MRTRALAVGVAVLALVVVGTTVRAEIPPPPTPTPSFTIVATAVPGPPAPRIEVPGEEWLAGDSYLFTGPDGTVYHVYNQLNRVLGSATPTPAPTPTPTVITMGETAVLVTDDSGNGGQILAQKATLGRQAVLTQLSFYVTTAAGNLRLGVYDATGLGGGPGILRAETAELAPIPGWNTTGVLAPVTLLPGTYWLAYEPSSGALGFKVDRASGSTALSARPYGPLPGAFQTNPPIGGFHFSFYATLLAP